MSRLMSFTIVKNKNFYNIISIDILIHLKNNSSFEILFIDVTC